MRMMKHGSLKSWRCRKLLVEGKSFQMPGLCIPAVYKAYLVASQSYALKIDYLVNPSAKSNLSSHEILTNTPFPTVGTVIISPLMGSHSRMQLNINCMICSKYARRRVVNFVVRQVRVRYRAVFWFLFQCREQGQVSIFPTRKHVHQIASAFTTLVLFK